VRRSRTLAGHASHTQMRLLTQVPVPRMRFHRGGRSCTRCSRTPTITPTSIHSFAAALRMVPSARVPVAALRGEIAYGTCTALLMRILSLRDSLCPPRLVSAAAHVRPLRYLDLCLSTCALTQRLCLLVLFLSVFHLMSHGSLSVVSVLTLDAACLAVGLAGVLHYQAGMRKEAYASQ
jgi:hypothetical protein